MFYLHQRMTATNFTLGGFSVCCGHSEDRVYAVAGHDEGEPEHDATSSEDDEDVLMLMVPPPGMDIPLLRLRDVLTIMRTLRCFVTCTLAATQFDKQRSGCVAKALSLLPNVAELDLEGPWLDSDLPTSGRFYGVERVYCPEDTTLTRGALRLLIPRMPNLVMLTFAHHLAAANESSATQFQGVETGDKWLHVKQVEHGDVEEDSFRVPGWACSTSLRSSVLRVAGPNTVWFRQSHDLDLLFDTDDKFPFPGK